MDKQKLTNESIKELQVLYNKGINISRYLREKHQTGNTPEIIEMAYDLQAGTYCEFYKSKQEVRTFYECAAKELAAVIHAYISEPKSILEAGIGEGQFLGELLGHMSGDIESYGFDISWSRVAYAHEWIENKGYKNSVLFTGDLLSIPCKDNAFDVVYTSHVVEPNRGSEENIIRELYRITKRYLILLEPSYEFASEEGRKRMDANGYIKGLDALMESLGYTVKEYKLFPYCVNPLNPTGIMIIEKGGNINDIETEYKYACPQFKTELERIGDSLYSSDGMRVYPIIKGIPCLRVENGIVASKYKMFKDFS